MKVPRLAGKRRMSSINKSKGNEGVNGFEREKSSPHAPPQLSGRFGVGMGLGSWLRSKKNLLDLMQN